MKIRNLIQVGSIYSTNYGKCKILKYINACSVYVKFIDTGYKTWTYSSALKSGEVKDPFVPNIFNIGYIGKLLPKNYRKEYSLWRNMLQRCYDPKIYNNKQCYLDCIVDSPWYNFSNFVEDIHKMKNWNKKGYQLDKDLRILGNKIYGKDFCSFVPVKINSLIPSKYSNKKSKFPVGITFNKNRYSVTVNKNTECFYLGTFSNIESAIKVYSKEKIKHIRYLADLYKSELHPQVYSNLYNITWKTLLERGE